MPTERLQRRKDYDYENLVLVGAAWDGNVLLLSSPEMACAALQACC
jgi:hypothetical protein